MNDPFIYYIIGFIIVVGIIIYLVSSTKENTVKRNLNSLKYKKISEIIDDEIVKVKGRVVIVEEFCEAPISKRKCVYYHVIVKKHTKSGKNTYTETLIDEEKGFDVVLKDEDNVYILIKTDFVNAHIFKDKEFTSGYFDKMEDSLKELLDRSGFRNIHTDFFSQTYISYEEGVLTEGEVVKVAGKAKWISKKEAGIDVPVEKVLMITDQEKESHYMSDDPSTIIASID